MYFTRLQNARNLFPDVKGNAEIALPENLGVK
jgi:hypothetical protein